MTSLINGILLNKVLIPNLLNNPLACWFLMNLYFFLLQIAQFDTSINLFCLVFLTLEFLLAVFCLTTDTIRFHCFYIVYFTAFSGFLISFFISLYFLNTLFTEINSSWLIYEFIKALQIRTSIAFKLVFANNTILSCFFCFSWLTYTF